MVNLDLDEATLEHLSKLEPVVLEHYYKETEQDTRVVLRDMTTEEF